jgi:hypothetical protein
MKIPVLAAALVGASAVNAQSASYPSDMPACGIACGNNMFAQASSLNCNSSTDYSCLCDNPDFLYGLRDCSNESCLNNTAANIAISWGNSFCASYSGTITLPSATGSNGSGATASTPTATTVVVATITSGSSTYVTTVSSTLYGAVPGATTGSGEATITTTIVSTGTSGGSSYTTTLGTSTITSGGSGASASESTSSSSTLTTYTTTTAASSTSRSSSSSGAAAQMTAGPVAGLVVAGLAAALW